MDEVIVIGAGAAGLAAADCLAAKGVSVTVLEARDRAGGRVFTLERATPIELGAEFIHGQKNEIWRVIREGGLRTHAVPDRHWRFARDRLIETRSYWDQLAEVTDRIERGAEVDQDVLSWLQGHGELAGDLRQMALDFVEGFHAAPAERMSLRALMVASQAAECEGGEKNYRVESGYSGLIGFMLSRALSRNVRLHLNTQVKTVHWEKGNVEVTVQTPGGERRLHGSRLLSTLPLGVLRSESGGVEFCPPLETKRSALEGLEMGQVVKIVLEFRSQFWPVRNFGFIHSGDEWLPTWWSDERGLLLTGWAGGPRAEWLGQENEATILNEAIRTLGRIFKMSRSGVVDLLVESWQHNWQRDPFSLGAYSYASVGGAGLPRQLAEPVRETLFFAGEATDHTGGQGTVHAAIGSGWRAAGEILASLRRRPTPHLTQC